MKINVDLQLLLYLLGYRSPIIYPLWLMILDKKNEEERTIFIENAIKIYLAEDTSDIDLDLDSLK